VPTVRPAPAPGRAGPSGPHPRWPGLLVGTSGWQYADWRGAFYPAGLGQPRWLGFYGSHYPTVEINNSFYRLPTAESFQRWRTSTPDGFCFAVKASRYLTHIRRLRGPGQPVSKLLGVARHLGPKLGPVLLQLPPRFACEVGRLEAALDAFGSTPVAVELRDERWHRDDVYDVLHRHSAALVWWDRRGAHGPLEQTTSWVYLRLHEGRGRTRPSYGRRSLETWSDRIASAYGDDARGFVFFNNDPGAAAVANASQFARIAAASGMPVLPTAHTRRTTPR
jgi:uncharacterized protein YecE (DUF72 family)